MVWWIHCLPWRGSCWGVLLQKGALEVRTPVSPFNCNKITSYLHVSRFNLVAHYLYMKPNFWLPFYMVLMVEIIDSLIFCLMKSLWGTSKHLKKITGHMHTYLFYQQFLGTPPLQKNCIYFVLISNVCISLLVDNNKIMSFFC